MSMVEKSDGCWTWTGQRGPSGYGKFAYRSAGRRTHARAHRVMWELENGPIPDSLFVCHHCDNPACVRPDHLFIGTPKDNTQDALMKGRLRTGPMPIESVRRGVDTNNVKLTEEKVLEIRSLASTGLSQSTIANRFGVKQAQVSAIVTGRSWAHVQVGIAPRLTMSEAGKRRSGSR
jgi:hypothetical protein